MAEVCSACGGKRFVKPDGSPVNSFEGSDYDPVVPCPDCREYAVLKMAEDHPGEGNVALSPSIEQLAAAQGVKPPRDISSLGGFLTDDEVDEFVSEIYGSRGRE